MKNFKIKALVTTSAIALSSLYSTAYADTEIASGTTPDGHEWDVRVGGYYNALVAYGTTDIDGVQGTDFDGVDVYTEGEIQFKPTITLDNGLKIGANIQIEESSNDRVDEAFLYIEGSFGRILVGDHDSAGYKMHYGAPNAAIIDLSEPSNFEPETLPEIVDAFTRATGGVFDGSSFVSLGSDLERGTLATTYIENDRNDEATRVTYFTPRFSGFQLGVSYARDGDDLSDDQADCDFRACNFFDIGANYVASFGDFNVALSGRYGIASGGDGQEDPNVYGAGFNIKNGGVTIGGSFAEQNDTPTSDGQSYDVGVSYKTGPWTFSTTYFHGENTDNEHAFASGGEFDEELSSFGADVRYKLAKGVSLNAFGAYVDFDEEIGDGGVGTAGNDADGFVIGTGIGLRF
jgi:hypothetical protein